MYTNICKVCIRACERKSSGLNLAAFRLLSGAVGERPRLGKANRSTLTSCQRMVYDGRALRSVCRNKRYSTSVKSQDATMQENESQENESPDEESLSGALTVGPDEELMQSLGEEDQRLLKMLWMELEVFRQSGAPVPQQMTSEEWTEAMALGSRSQRISYYRHLCIKESRRKKDKQKKEDRRIHMEKVREEREVAKASDPEAYYSDYGLGRNCMFLRFSKQTLNKIYNSWQRLAILFGEKIVLDLGYDEFMVERELRNCAEQIRESYAYNRMNRQAFHLHLCNAHPDSKLLRYLEKYIPNLHQSKCMMTVTEKSYLELFPKDKLVYLTPHCQNDLNAYEHDTVYIVGALVDKTVQKPVSMAKAKNEGLRMARLPLDKYLTWGTGQKSLTLDQMMRIMLDIKNTSDWNVALKHVPQRKLKDNSFPRPGPRYRNSRKCLIDQDDD